MIINDTGETPQHDPLDCYWPALFAANELWPWLHEKQVGPNACVTTHYGYVAVMYPFDDEVSWWYEVYTQGGIVLKSHRNKITSMRSTSAHARKFVAGVILSPANL